MEKPNWRVWRSTPKVEVWEACVLAVGLEPSSMKSEKDSWMYGNGKGPYITSKSFPNTEIEQDYKDLFDVLTANLIEHKPFNVPAIPGLGRGFCTIRLDVFVAWATSEVKWLDLPPELAGLVLDKTNGDSKASREVLINRDKQASLTKAISQEKPRRDFDLTTEISQAINTAQDPNSTASVWTSLRNMALNGEGLFTGNVDEKGLHYQKSAGNGATILTKQALSKRLNRKKSRGAT